MTTRMNVSCDSDSTVILQHGKIKEVRIVTYRNGMPKGLAYVEYENEARTVFLVTYIFVLIKAYPHHSSLQI